MRIFFEKFKPLQCGKRLFLAGTCWAGITSTLFVFLPTASLAAAHPAIANTPPCNSSQMVFRPTSQGEQKALAFVHSLSGLKKVEQADDGTYVAEFGSADEVNTLISDLNQNHAAQVIDMFQFFQCKYKMF